MTADGNKGDCKQKIHGFTWHVFPFLEGTPLAPVETLGSRAGGAIPEVMAGSLSINGPVWPPERRWR